jgi:hypothetical protein
VPDRHKPRQLRSKHAKNSLRNVYIPKRGGMAFFPNQISGLQFWFDAADQKTVVTTGNNLTSWINKGLQSGKNISVNGGTPTYGTAQLNGTNLVSLPSGAILQFTGAFTNQARTRFFVTRPTTNTQTTRPTFLASGSGSGQETVNFFEGTLIQVAELVQFGLRSVALPNLQNQPLILTFVNSSSSTANNRLAINGTAQTLTENNTASGYITTEVTNLINNVSGGGQELGEWIAYNNALTPAEALQVEGYLAWKWGLFTSLPDTHPFRFYPPGAQLIPPLNDLFLINTSNNPGALLMPSSIGLANRVLTIKDIGGNLNISSLTLYANNQIDTFEGSTSIVTLSNNYDFLKLMSDGAGRWLFLDGTVMNSYRFDNTLTNASSLTTLGISSFQTVGASTFQLVDASTGGTSNFYQSNGALFIDNYAFAGTTAGSVLTLTPQNLFTPSNLTGVRLWIDAASPDTVFLSSGRDVLGVLDKSGNGNTLSNGAFFTYNDVKFNDVYPSFFNNANISGAFIGFRTSFACSQPFTFCVAGQATGGASLRTFFDRVNTIGQSVSARVNNTDWQVYMEAGTTRAGSGGNTSSPFIFVGTFNSNVSVGFTNGLQTLSGNIGTNNLTSIVIGNFNSSNRRYLGHIAEMFFVGGAITTANREAVEGYLAWKWGLVQNLPSDHPFKNAPP